jgi:thioredoxin-like negative regulator of GroEL
MKILRFGAIWCMYCLYMRPFWEEIEREFVGFEMAEYDADDQAEIHKRYAIKDIPTVIILDESGAELGRIEGAKEKEELKKILEEYITTDH